MEAGCDNFIRISSARMTEVWKCPELRMPDDIILRDVEVILAEIGELDVFPCGPIGVAGMELRAALLLFRNSLPISEPDNGFWQAKCQALFIRPAIEPIVCSFWSDLIGLRFDPAKAARIVSALTGGEGSIREGEAKGRSGGKELVFEDPRTAASWLSKLKLNAFGQEARLTSPVFSFAQVIMSHPFKDGNGRFARAMMHAALGRSIGLGRPVVALTPAIYRHAERIRLALSALNQSGDWNPVFKAFNDVLSDAITTTRALIELERNAEQRQSGLMRESHHP